MANHLTDSELLQYTDGELRASRAIEVKEHLRSCRQCRARHSELEQTIDAYVEHHQREWRDRIPPLDGPLALFRAQLALTATTQPARPWYQIGGTRSALALAGTLAAALVIAGYFVSFHSADYEPNSVYTPGATVPVTREALCSDSQRTNFRTIAASTAAEVFRSYGILHPKPRQYEVDYLIPPDLGGAEDTRNLWPQPYSSGVWNSRIKDALEDRLRTLVCSGEMELSEAQHEIARDWVGAYRKHFGTSEPLASHRAFSKDLPWE